MDHLDTQLCSLCVLLQIKLSQINEVDLAIAAFRKRFLRLQLFDFINQVKYVIKLTPIGQIVS